jgi:hypothetical protein
MGLCVMGWGDGGLRFELDPRLSEDFAEAVAVREALLPGGIADRTWRKLLISLIRRVAPAGDGRSVHDALGRASALCVPVLCAGVWSQQLARAGLYR